MSSPPVIFDSGQIARNLARRANSANFVRDLVVDDLVDRMGAYKRDFARAVLIAPDVADLPDTFFTANGPVHVARVEAFSGAEFPDLPTGELDLVISLLHLQVVDDVPGHLLRLRRQLKPDGLLLAAFLGGDTLTELREAFLAADLAVTGGASARVAPMAQVRDAGALLQRAGFALPVADVETHRVRYANPFALMAEIKALGAANPLRDRPRHFATRRLLAAAAEAYARRDSDADGRIRATLELIWVAGWVPHESQQKPLKPGSATVSMTQILSSKKADTP
ncbi:MAG: SAM-dependent methyltransferase [Devosia sp.]|uniref:SAM-dependent methyltransferase n=1 Tax=Devosia sp. TaxID=1871048 RepID=UPI0024C99552|nr:SAM-dependent methyltransferase [Devosia sp.]UYN98424.1 MAG: SAM-dependent methyltransferase [Devosia sp.]